MSKRKEFYLSTDVWDKGLSCSAKTVLAYLSYCANRAGECFPSIGRIASESSVCKNTARKAIGELKTRGLLTSRERIEKGKKGVIQRSNVYTLLTSRGLPEGYEPKENAKENANANANAKEPSPISKAAPEPAPGSVPAAAPAAVPQAWEDPLGDAELRLLLDRLDLRNIYAEGGMGKALELAITELWFSESFRYKGRSVPRAQVRYRLRELDVDALDTAIRSVLSQDYRDRPALLMACIYEAPLRSGVETALSIAEAEQEHEWMRSWK